MSVETPMTKALLIERMRDGRAAWEAALVEVPAAHVAEPGVEGHWSAKDVIAHVTVYEVWTADQLEGVLRGETAMVVRPDEPEGAGTSDTDQQNAAYYEVYKDRPLDAILAEAERAFPRLLAAVEALPEDVLLERGRLDWLGDTALWELIAGNSYDHCAEHLAAIRAWLERGVA